MAFPGQVDDDTSSKFNDFHEGNEVCTRVSETQLAVHSYEEHSNRVSRINSRRRESMKRLRLPLRGSNAQHVSNLKGTHLRESLKITIPLTSIQSRSRFWREEGFHSQLYTSSEKFTLKLSLICREGEECCEMFRTDFKVGKGTRSGHERFCAWRQRKRSDGQGIEMESL